LDAAAVGLVEFVDFDLDDYWLLKVREHFTRSVPLLKWRKENSIIDEIFRSPRRLTLDELSRTEEQEVLRICSQHVGVDLADSG
jgi:hypothetical protein